MTPTSRSLVVLLGTFTLSALSFAALASAWGADAEGLRATLRLSGRVSFVLFLLPFVASSALRLWPSAATRWLMKNRRDLGLAFAGAQLAHLGLIVELARGTAHVFPPLVLAVGGLGFVLIIAMAVTSFPAPRRFIGPRRWRTLHRSGIAVIAAIFAYDFYGGMLRDPLLYAPFAAVLTAAIGVRYGSSLSTRAVGMMRRQSR